MKKITREVFIASDGQEFETESDAMQHEIVLSLQDAPNSIYLDTWLAKKAAEVLMAKFDITERPARPVSDGC